MSIFRKCNWALSNSGVRTILHLSGRAGGVKLAAPRLLLKLPTATLGGYHGR